MMIDSYEDTAVTPLPAPREPVERVTDASPRGVDTDDVVDMLRELSALGRLRKA